MLAIEAAPEPGSESSRSPRASRRPAFAMTGSSPSARCGPSRCPPSRHGRANSCGISDAARARSASNGCCAIPPTAPSGSRRAPDRAERAARNAAALGVPRLEVVTRPGTRRVGGLAGARRRVHRRRRPRVRDDRRRLGGVAPGRKAGRQRRDDRDGGRVLAGRARLGGTLTRISIERLDSIGGMHGFRPAMTVTQWAGGETVSACRRPRMPTRLCRCAISRRWMRLRASAGRAARTSSPLPLSSAAEAGLAEAAARLGVPLVLIDDAALADAQTRCVTRSERAGRPTGFASVAEAAALAAVGAGAAAAAAHRGERARPARWPRRGLTVHFIGAGPGAPDLITVRGRDLLAHCPVCLYAGSIVPRAMLAHCPPDARLVDTAPLSLGRDRGGVCRGARGGPGRRAAAFGRPFDLQRRRRADSGGSTAAASPGRSRPACLPSPPPRRHSDAS